MKHIERMNEFLSDIDCTFDSRLARNICNNAGLFYETLSTAEITCDLELVYSYILIRTLELERDSELFAKESYKNIIETKITNAFVNAKESLKLLEKMKPDEKQFRATITENELLKIANTGLQRERDELKEAYIKLHAENRAMQFAINSKYGNMLFEIKSEGWFVSSESCHYYRNNKDEYLNICASYKALNVLFIRKTQHEIQQERIKVCPDCVAILIDELKLLPQDI